MADINYHYMRLAGELEEKIRSGRYRAGEKLPSLRVLKQQTGRSMSTVYHAYEELEQRGLIDVREKSGFFVRPLIEKVLPPPSTERRIVRPHKVEVNEMATLLQQATSNPNLIGFGTALPSPELLPTKQLARELRGSAVKYATGEMIGYCHPTGFKPLQDEIEKRMVGYFNCNLGDEVIITGGCLAAIDLCLRAVSEKGDTVLVESPTFLCYLQLIEDLNMRALEVPVDPQTGLDPELLVKLLDTHEVCGALLNTNFHNPLGYVMSDARKKQLVDIFHQRQLPIIEDDIYGDLYFGTSRPRPLKAFDREGLVLYCSSFTKTMAADLRIGWTVPGIFSEKIKRMKFNSSVASQQLIQFVIANFLASGGHERHLRRMRNSLKNQLGSLLNAIARFFPEGTRVSAPKGGLCLWVELDRRVDGVQLMRQAVERNISLVPGSFCTSTGEYDHCIRLNFGHSWSEKNEEAIAVLAELIQAQLVA